MANRVRKFRVFDFDFLVDYPTPTTYQTHVSTDNYQEISSQGNPGYRNLRGYRGDVGSPFFSLKKSYFSAMGTVKLTAVHSSGKVLRYQGMQFPCGPTSTTMTSGMSLPNSISPSETTELNALGTTAIARTMPTNPSSAVLNFAGELYRDGIPSMVGSGLLKSRLKDYRELGSEYLNVEFGWKPFVSDLTSIFSSVQDSERILAQARHDSGQLIHRRYDFPSTNTTVIDPPVANSSPFPGGSTTGEKDFFGGSYPRGDLLVSTTTSVDTWFEGAFVFYYPVGDSQLDKIRQHAFEANKLLGLRLTPEVLWNYTPWTWLADWVGNTGDIVHNISQLGQDGLALKYGYMMRHKKMTRTAVLRLNKPRIDGTSEFSLSYTVESKARLKATPYGFGLSWDGFSPRQWAILGAIGLSNGRKTSY